MAEDDELTETELLRAILALLIDERIRAIEAPSKPPAIELVLSSAGLDYRIVARILDKKPDAVRMAISRANQRGGH